MKFFLLLFIFLNSCDLDNGRLFPEDSDDNDIVSTASIPKIFTLYSGGNSNCYIYDSFKVKCWGEHDYSSIASSNPSSMSLGRGFACYLDQSNDVSCISNRDDLDLSLIHI